MSTDVRVERGPAGTVLHVTRRYPHSVDRVWAALTEPDRLSRWFPCEVEADVRVGGLITFRFGPDDVDTAEITELDPPRVLAFLWSGEHLRWTLTPDGDGCTLHLANPVADPGWTANTAAGWDRCFGALTAVLGGGPVPVHRGPDEALTEHYRTVLAP
ncbi:SRPBCC family protein [Pseudonocardia sp. HH130630-07]|uniref:SRPBCC family protein n=1 Tax=Pseudonocardia sp. HH130630-07 TaxID=1690815 RepID=UPI000814F981|nr:SRPBCC family protein [Pseudonocardia sp. HH130630-07]ANY07344.1 ATPase [Pseudonocardia sp. HH130630-07]